MRRRGGRYEARFGTLDEAMTYARQVGPGTFVEFSPGKAAWFVPIDAPRVAPLGPPAAYLRACREAFRTVRRDVWSDRESRLRAKWESYG